MSKFVTLHGFGSSGGVELNFDIKRYNNEDEMLADTPTENTIGIISDAEIDGWIFSANQPTNPSVGMVLISTDILSSIEFNALKKNNIQVYPVSVKQYTGNAWVGRTAKIIQNGEWSDIICTYLYNNGDECIKITGGWHTFGWIAYSGRTSKAPTVTRNSTSIYAYSSGRYCEGVLITTNRVNLSNYSTLRFYGSAVGSIHLCVWPNLNGNALDNGAFINAELNNELDISSINGEHYIGFHFNTVEYWTTTLTFTKIVLM